MIDLIPLEQIKIELTESYWSLLKRNDENKLSLVNSLSRNEQIDWFYNPKKYQEYCKQYPKFGDRLSGLFGVTNLNSSIEFINSIVETLPTDFFKSKEESWYLISKYITNILKVIWVNTIVGDSRLTTIIDLKKYSVTHIQNNFQIAFNKLIEIFSYNSTHAPSYQAFKIFDGERPGQARIFEFQAELSNVSNIELFETNRIKLLESANV